MMKWRGPNRGMPARSPSAVLTSTPGGGGTIDGLSAISAEFTAPPMRTPAKMARKLRTMLGMEPRAEGMSRHHCMVDLASRCPALSRRVSQDANAASTRPALKLPRTTSRLDQSHGFATDEHLLREPIRPPERRHVAVV